MTQTNVCWVVAVLFCVGACRATVVRPAPEHAELSTAPVLDAGRATNPSVDAGDPTLSPTYEAKIDELERIEDWRSTVWGSRAPNPPDPQRARVLPRRGTFAYGKIASIRAYHFSHFPLIGMMKQGDMPYAKDGSLDRHIILPEATLDDRERDQIIDGLREMERREHEPVHTIIPSMQCESDAHHAFVFFEANGTPIAKLIVTFACPEFMAVPETKQFGSIYPQMLPEDLYRILFEIANRHGLDAWADRDDEVLSAYRNRRYGSPKNPTELGRARLERQRAKPSGLPPDLNASQASKEDHERFCVWLHGAISSCTEAPVEECEKKPLCNAPFAKIESCVRASFFRPDASGTTCRDGRTSPECAGLLGCLPFLDAGSLR